MRLNVGPCRFKIGVTCDPRGRWYKYSSPYCHEFEQMDINCMITCRESAYLLEVALIKEFWNEPGCINRERRDRGGTGSTPLGLNFYYVYCVWIYESGMSERVAAFREQRVIPDEYKFRA